MESDLFSFASTHLNQFFSIDYLLRTEKKAQKMQKISFIFTFAKVHTFIISGQKLIQDYIPIKHLNQRQSKFTLSKSDSMTNTFWNIMTFTLLLYEGHFDAITKLWAEKLSDLYLCHKDFSSEFKPRILKS